MAKQQTAENNWGLKDAPEGVTIPQVSLSKVHLTESGVKVSHIAICFLFLPFLLDYMNGSKELVTARTVVQARIWVSDGSILPYRSLLVSLNSVAALSLHLLSACEG